MPDGLNVVLLFVFLFYQSGYDTAECLAWPFQIIVGVMQTRLEWWQGGFLPFWGFLSIKWTGGNNNQIILWLLLQGLEVRLFNGFSSAGVVIDCTRISGLFEKDFSSPALLLVLFYILVLLLFYIVFQLQWFNPVLRLHWIILKSYYGEWRTCTKIAVWSS